MRIKASALRSEIPASSCATQLCTVCSLVDAGLQAISCTRRPISPTARDCRGHAVGTWHSHTTLRLLHGNIIPPFRSWPHPCWACTDIRTSRRKQAIFTPPSNIIPRCLGLSADDMVRIRRGQSGPLQLECSSRAWETWRSPHIHPAKQHQFYARYLSSRLRMGTRI